jgi:flagellar hook-length control protein FliK
VATPVPLARAAEAVEHVLRLASGRGVTHARIALRPAELGSVDVHLRSTAEGIVARVVAQSAETVQTLQHAANDLRRALEEQGLNVLNLDIGQSGERSAGRAGSGAGELAGGDGDRSSSSTAETEDTSTETTTLRLPTGVLVDVLA